MKRIMRLTNDGRGYYKNPLLLSTVRTIENDASSVYLFENGDLSAEEIDTDDIERKSSLSRIRCRTGNSSENLNLTHLEETFVTRPVGPDDSVQSLALKYSCKVSELKRINNLQKDQDFFALRSVKIPAKQHGILLELYGNEIKETDLSCRSSRSRTDPNIHSDENSDSDCRLSSVQTLSINDNLRPQTKEAVDFLKSMDNDIKSILTNNSSQVVRHSNESRTYVPSRKFFLQHPACKSKGADWGIKWTTLIAILIIVGIVAPLLYFIYYELYKRSDDKSSKTATPH